MNELNEKVIHEHNKPQCGHSAVVGRFYFYTISCEYREKNRRAKFARNWFFL